MTITTSESLPSKSELTENPINYAKVIILGASGVGKTSIIKVNVIFGQEENKIAKKLTFQRFMSNTFDSQHTPTVTKCDFYPSLVYECSIVEVIMVKMFYQDSELQQNYEKKCFLEKIVDIFRILFSLVSSCGFASDRKLSNNK